MRYGRTVEDGFLPVYSVDTEEEAQALLRFACPTNVNGEFVAPELATEQTIPNLFAFGRRLANAHRLMCEKAKPAQGSLFGETGSGPYDERR